ncbi:hypothetical protein Avbf_15831 [Armadillidium vulgare]|nr:hypothetical protein Avbf_15831 [Armadillidium vulgare]
MRDVSVSQRIRQSQGQICYTLKICQNIPFGLASLFQFEAVKDSLNLELPSTLLCKNMGLVGIRLTIFTLINFVAKSNCGFILILLT